jgi:DNA-directed RNA polymerase subunit beta
LDDPNKCKRRYYYIVKYLIELINAKADIDDIDHLSNRRVRTVGEQLSQQFGLELVWLEPLESER